MKLQIWDTAGQERFRSITNNYYNGSHGIAIVYDITNRESFDCVEKWMNDVKNLANPHAVKMLVGNKVDLDAQRQVAREEGERMAEALGIPFIETSAKTAFNVNEMFNLMCYEIAKRQSLMPKQSAEGQFPLPDIQGTRVSENRMNCPC